MFLIVSKMAVAQEHLTPYYFQPPLKYEVENNANKGGAKSAILLPFFDDFSQNHTYPVNQTAPNPKLWADREAFINMNFGVNPPSMGVATLDGLNKGGKPYSYILNSFGYADSLTSVEIDLSPFTAVDSIYFSFFFEPQGSGDYPDIGDSLVLQFKKADSTWVTIWGVDGSLTAPVNGNYFTQKIFLLDSAYFFFNNFQFRFTNIATYGNNDHWNIDYVKLNKNRNRNDTIINDVSFIDAPTNPLTNYFQMPWRQFVNNQATEMGSDMKINLYNNWSSPKNVNYGCEVYDDNCGTPINTFPTPSILINASSYASPKLDYTGTPLYTVPAGLCVDNNCTHTVDNKFYCTPGAAEYSNNDTLVYQLKFKNYFAYDDGTAEFGYGLLGTGKVAYEFKLNVADTITAIQIHWAHILADNSTKLFNLKVWQAIDLVNGTSDVVSYTKRFCKVVYTDSYFDSINGFSTYLIDTPQVLNPGTFYVGWESIDPVILNVGFDVNEDAHQHLYYNTGGSWVQSLIAGAVMIRPQFGTACLDSFSTAINDPSTTLRVTGKLEVYPNPVGDELSVICYQLLGNANTIQIYDVLGRLQNQPINNSTNQQIKINVANLSSGIYFIKATDAKGNIRTAKFVKE